MGTGVTTWEGCVAAPREHELRRPVRGRLRWGQTCTRARPEETRLGIRTGISEVKGNAI